MDKQKSGQVVPGRRARAYTNAHLAHTGRHACSGHDLLPSGLYRRLRPLTGSAVTSLAPSRPAISLGGIMARGRSRARRP